MDFLVTFRDLKLLLANLSAKDNVQPSQQPLTTLTSPFLLVPQSQFWRSTFAICPSQQLGQQEASLTINFWRSPGQSKLLLIQPMTMACSTRRQQQPVWAQFLPYEVDSKNVMCLSFFQANGDNKKQGWRLIFDRVLGNQQSYNSFSQRQRPAAPDRDNRCKPNSSPTKAILTTYV